MLNNIICYYYGIVMSYCYIVSHSSAILSLVLYGLPLTRYCRSVITDSLAFGLQSVYDVKSYLNCET